MIVNRAPVLSRIFVLESPDGNVLIAFEARSLTEAQQLRKESWLCDELAEGRDGKPVSNVRTMRARPASADEITAYRAALASASAPKEDDLYLAYLSN